jgi:hypothetical protein
MFWPKSECRPLKESSEQIPKGIISSSLVPYATTIVQKTKIVRDEGPGYQMFGGNIMHLFYNGLSQTQKSLFKSRDIQQLLALVQRLIASVNESQRQTLVHILSLVTYLSKPLAQLMDQSNVQQVTLMKNLQSLYYRIYDGLTPAQLDFLSLIMYAQMVGLYQSLTGVQQRRFVDTAFNLSSLPKMQIEQKQESIISSIVASLNSEQQSEYKKIKAQWEEFISHGLSATQHLQWNELLEQISLLWRSLSLSQYAVIASMSPRLLELLYWLSRLQSQLSPQLTTVAPIVKQILSTTNKSVVLEFISKLTRKQQEVLIEILPKFKTVS